MKHTLKKIFTPVAVFVLFFAAGWATIDLSEEIVFKGLQAVDAVLIDCTGCENHDGGGGGSWGGGGGFGGWGGGGEIGGGGGGGGGYTPPAPVCTLTLTKDKITWTTKNAVRVDIVPLTNSPAVPGASAPQNPAPGTVVISKDFGILKAQYLSVLQQEVGGYTIDGFYADKPTADRICQAIAPGTVSGAYQWDAYSSPKNNTVLKWNGSNWNQYNAKDYNRHFRYNFTCIVPLTGNSPYALSGSTNFVPPLGVGTHTYKLIATGNGSNGNTTCQATVVVPPPPADGCIEIKKETYNTTGTEITPVAQFTFTLDGNRTTTNDATGYARFDNVSVGTHTIAEVDPGSSWEMISITPLNGTVTVPKGPNCVAVVIKNKQVLPPPGDPVCTLTADPTKVDYNGYSTLTWTTKNAVKFEINKGIGQVSPVAGGDVETGKITANTTFTGTAYGSNGKTATCKVTVKLNPPPGPGCIEIKKETYNTTGQELTPVAQFTFKLDDGRIAKNDSTGYARFDNVSAGWHEVEELSAGNTWELISVTPSNGKVNVPEGDKCAALVFKNKQKIPTSKPLECTLKADPTSVSVGNSSTLTWTTKNAVSFTIDNGIGAVAIAKIPGGSTTTPALTTTSVFTGTAKNAEGDTITCTAEVGVLSTPDPFCKLTVSKSQINPGESISISWTSANVTTGFIDNNVGTTSPVVSGTINDVFPSSDTLYTGTFKGPYGDVTCTAEVRIKKTTGCVGNCGGGLEQPNVQLSRLTPPTEQPLAFVSLSQIPYTGFEAGTTLTLVFWTVVALWSVAVTYIFMGKGGIQFFANRAFAVATPVARREEDANVSYEPAQVEESEEVEVAQPQKEAFVEPVQHVYQSTITTPVRAYTAPVATAPVAQKPAFTPKHDATDGLPEVSDVIESRAHAAGVLLSPEAVSIAVGLSTDRAQTLQRFGELLNEAVRTIPREDGWVLLSAERMRTLVAEVKPVDSIVAHVTPLPAKPVAPVVDASAADRFVATLLSGDRDGAFSILNALEHEGASTSRFATGVATILDKLYRSRKTGVQFDDVQIKEKAVTISDEGLQQLVEVFVHALDTAYASKYTGLKIAVAQAFDIRSA